jgi:UDP-N-acetylmuramate dehydrogenase
VEVETAHEARTALAIAGEAGVPVFVLGGGSNTLVSDRGFEGLVLSITNRDVEVLGERVMAGAGALSVTVARRSLKAGLTGFEWAVSLPGTIGGAVRGNAGCFGGEMGQVVDRVRLLAYGSGKEGEEMGVLTNQELQFGYRDSILKHDKGVVLDVTLRLRSDDPRKIQQQMDEVLRKRKATQPVASGSCGCAFKNIAFTSPRDLGKLRQKFSDIPPAFLERKRIGAGWLMDKLGL